MRFALTDRQVKELQNFLHSTKDRHEHTRALALLMRAEGSTVEKVASTLRVCVDIVFRWSRSYRKNDGIDGIRSKKPSGRPPVIKNKAKQIIPKLLKKDPKAFGYLKGRWVVRDIADALEEEGIPISFKHVHNILKDLGLSYKRPKLTVKSNDSQYARKEREVRNYKKVSAMLVKKGYW